MSEKKPMATFRREGFELRMAPWTAKHLVEHHLQRLGRILDVGCGDGVLTTYIDQQLKWPVQRDRLFGLDINEYPSTSRPPPNTWSRLDPQDFLGFKPKVRFRYVLMTEYLEHVADPQAHLRKARSMLEPEGRLIVQCPNAYTLNRLLGLKMGVIDHIHRLTGADLKAGHRRFYNLEKLRDEIQNAGFITTHWHTYFFKPLPNRDMELVMSQGDRSDIMQGLYTMLESPGVTGALVCVEGVPDPEARP